MNDPFYEFDSLNNATRFDFLNDMATTHKDRIATATAVKKKNEGRFATEREASEAKNGELMML